MKTSTSIRFAAAGVIGLASMAQAQSVCAINCFQSVITDHPPLDCTEENMYLCFCKRSNLQNWFAECIWDECGSQSDAAIAFGVNLCADYGITITPPTKPEEEPTTTKTEPEPTTAAEEEPEETQAEEEPESTQAEPKPTTAAEEQPEETQAEETEAEESQPAEETKATTAAAPAETTAETSAAAPKPTTVVTKPSHAGNTTVVTGSPTNPPTVVNMGASNVASGILAAAGLAVAAFQLL
ncbi:hypothetical protein CEP51_001490 [Fusarium floridanum]|uniref:CFEM domain-containing protein n=1 Tax=Fusarium floridanum TaxID=1325733 RepID=A0A428SGG5_9HYPO|nr:hypothetical protein CEP51_001490 [Fusarium floridanum]